MNGYTNNFDETQYVFFIKDQDLLEAHIEM